MGSSSPLRIMILALFGGLWGHFCPTGQRPPTVLGSMGPAPGQPLLKRHAPLGSARCAPDAGRRGSRLGTVCGTTLGAGWQTPSVCGSHLQGVRGSEPAGTPICIISENKTSKTAGKMQCRKHDLQIDLQLGYVCGLDLQTLCAQACAAGPI